MSDDTAKVRHDAATHNGEDGELLELMSARDRLRFALEAAGQEQVAARLERVVDTVCDRLWTAFDEESRRLGELESKMRAKADRAWQPLVHAEIARIEKEGALVPGLSHQEIYLAELREACGRADTLDALRDQVEGLIGKWGSALKYPLFASGRKKELTELLRRVEEGFPEARTRAVGSVRSSVAARREEARDTTRERIRSIALDFGGLLSASFESDLTAEETIRLRWLLISLVNKRVFARLMAAVAQEDGRTQDHLYYVVERLLRQVYDSFKTFIVAYKKRAMDTDALDAVSGVIELEIRATQTVTAQFEQQIRSQPLTPVLVQRIKSLLRSDTVKGASGPDAFVAVSGGLRGDTRFAGFLSHLKSSPDLDDQVADEVAVAVKTTVEPFRSLYYVAITLVRYLKGLQNFKPA